MSSRELTNELIREICTEWNEGAKARELMHKHSLAISKDSPWYLANILDRGDREGYLTDEGRSRRRRRKTDYDKLREEKFYIDAKEYWKDKQHPPREDTLTWILIPQFGHRNTRSILEGWAFIKKYEWLRNLLGAKIS